MQLLSVSLLQPVCLFLALHALVQIVLIDKLNNVGGEEAIHELLLDLRRRLLGAS